MLWYVVSRSFLAKVRYSVNEQLTNDNPQTITDTLIYKY